MKAIQGANSFDKDNSIGQDLYQDSLGKYPAMVKTQQKMLILRDSMQLLFTAI